MYNDPNKFLAIILVTTTLSYLISIIISFVYKEIGGLDKSIKNVQSSHVNSTPRLGGLSIFAAIIIVEYIFGSIFILWFFWAILPLFIIGLIEDCHFDTSPKIRLLVGILSSLIAIFMTGSWISSVDFLLFDWILGIAIFGIIFTVFASVGMINAINIIDGIHGFASANIVITSIAIFLISNKVGEPKIATMAALVAAASLGLFFSSYPSGRIFLGDAGAYTLGFLIAWQIILLFNRNEDLSAWSMLAITFWPVMDTIFSIFRRIKRGKDTKKPDLLHFHQLVMRFWEIISRKRISREVSNPLATATILPFAILPVVFGILYHDNIFIGQLIIFIFTIMYLVSYFVIFNILKKRSFRIFLSSLI